MTPRWIRGLAGMIATAEAGQEAKSAKAAIRLAKDALAATISAAARQRKAVAAAQARVVALEAAALDALDREDSEQAADLRRRIASADAGLKMAEASLKALEEDVSRDREALDLAKSKMAEALEAERIRKRADGAGATGTAAGTVGTRKNPRQRVETGEARDE